MKRKIFVYSGLIGLVVLIALGAFVYQSHARPLFAVHGVYVFNPVVLELKTGEIVECPKGLIIPSEKKSPVSCLMYYESIENWSGAGFWRDGIRGYKISVSPHALFGLEPVITYIR